ncbi:MAG: hypothetical protein ACRCXC_05220 [Legionella sp.]
MSQEKVEFQNTRTTQEVNDIKGVSRQITQELMTAAKIPGVAVASYHEGQLVTMSVGKTITERDISALHQLRWHFNQISLD